MCYILKADALGGILANLWADTQDRLDRLVRLTARSVGQNFEGREEWQMARQPDRFGLQL